MIKDVMIYILIAVNAICIFLMNQNVDNLYLRVIDAEKDIAVLETRMKVYDSFN